MQDNAPVVSSPVGAIQPKLAPPRCDLMVFHEPDQNAVQRIASTFGPHNPDAIAGSWVEAAGLGTHVIYSARRNSYAVFVMTGTATRMDIVLEQQFDLGVPAVNDAWRELRRALKPLKPSLQRAEVYERSGKVSAVGRVGWARSVWHREVLRPSIVGLLSVVVGVVVGYFQHSWLALAGAVPPVVNGVLVVGSAVRAWYSGAIRWTLNE